MTKTTYAIQFRPEGYENIPWLRKEEGFDHMETARRHLETYRERNPRHDYRIVRVEITEVE